MDRLSGKAALITGAASGIGKATALLFAAEGAAVALADRSAVGSEVAASINAAGGRAWFRQADLAEIDAAVIVEKAVGWLGRLDIFFGNAGINPHLGDITAVRSPSLFSWRHSRSGYQARSCCCSPSPGSAF